VTDGSLPRLKIFFDGGCRPNPGTMETAVVVRGQAYIQRDVGYGTSMDAEWLALIHALQFAQELQLSNFILLGDSASVVGQANGTQKCRGVNMRHLLAFRALLSGVNEPRIRYIKRAQNLAGIALARMHPR
jgi:ribonuclease HI